MLTSKLYAKHIIGSLSASVAATGLYFLNRTSASCDTLRNDRERELQLYLPSRQEVLTELKSGKIFDLLIIGGGATGTGIALDATLRGLSVALVEGNDYASATSSRSTKLLHGGVRYLEKAFKNFDLSQFQLVFDALRERSNALSNAPHLTNKIPIMMPCYTWWEIPYFWAGMKAYDVLSFRRSIGSSRYLTYDETLDSFPVLDRHNLKGSIIYYDGMMNDSRLNVGLAMTALSQGAKVANHIQVINLLKEVPSSAPVVRSTAPLSHVKGTTLDAAGMTQSSQPVGRALVHSNSPALPDPICGVEVKDMFTQETWTIRSKVVVNATGPYVDHIRRIDNPEVPLLISPSAGSHVVLPSYYGPSDMGLIIPKTDDNRVAFMLPWNNRIIVGTTDTQVQLTSNPIPDEDDINWILNTISKYLNFEVQRKDVLSAWKGIRPLAANSPSDGAVSATENITREHLIEVSPSNLLTITGGKWTTYRKMAEEVVDEALKIVSVQSPVGPCRTEHFPIIGANGWDKNLYMELIRHKKRTKQLQNGEIATVPFSVDIAQHLSNAYGTRALLIADIAEQGYGNRLVPHYPNIEAEVVYVVEHEQASTVADVLARRMRLAFLDVDATIQALPRTIDIMANLLGWDSVRKKQEYVEALQILSN